MRIIALLLIIFGGLGVFAQTMMIIDGDMHQAISGFVLLGGFTVLGFLGIYYKKINYKGSTPSIIGALLLFWGTVTLTAELGAYGMGKPETIWEGILFSFLLIVVGFVLLWSGHKSHILKTRFEK